VQEEPFQRRYPADRERSDEEKAQPEGHVVNREDRILIDPAILAGKPVVKGTRLAVGFILELLAQGWAEDAILKNYPGLTHQDILACLAYASERLEGEQIYPLPGQ
jgi:uncharacterized protein (DUF433 family)